MSTTISRRTAVLAALASAAGGALPTVAGASASTVDVPVLPTGEFEACVLFWHRTPDEFAEGFAAVHVEPDAAGVPRLSLARRGDCDRRPIDADSEPETHQAAAALIAALLATGDSPLGERR